MFRSTPNTSSNRTKVEIEVSASGQPKGGKKEPKKTKSPPKQVGNYAPINTRNPISLGTGPPTKVKHREMVATYTVPTGASFPEQVLLSQRLNPANGVLFPWAARVARNYEKYVVRNVKIIVVSNNATTTGGWLAAAVDRDSSDPTPFSKQDMMNMGYAKADAVWSGFEFSVPCDNSVRFVDSQVSASDQRLVDFGKLYLAAFSATAGATLDLYMQYEFDFFVPSANYTNTQILNTSVLWTLTDVLTGQESFGPGFVEQDKFRGAGYFVFRTTGTFLVSSEIEGSSLNAAGWATGTGSDITATVVGGGETANRSAFNWLLVVRKAGNFAWIRNSPPTGASITRARLVIQPLSSAEAAFFAL